jgi:hypothetical protein
MSRQQPSRSAKDRALETIEHVVREKITITKNTTCAEQQQQFIIIDLDNSDNGEDEDSSDEVGDETENLATIFPPQLEIPDDPSPPLDTFRWRHRPPAPTDASYLRPAITDPLPYVENVDYFKHFISDTLLEEIAMQTNLYSVQKSGGVTSVNTCKGEIEVFIGAILKMGVFNLPQLRMYWSPSTRIPSIADAFEGGVNRFKKLKSCLHFNDNTKTSPTDRDKLYKVRPLVDAVKKACNSLPTEEKHSIDEQVIPTKGRSAMRQYLPKKPNKWGIKVFARCGITGILYDFFIYTGKSSEPSSLLGVSADTVMTLCATLEKHVNHKLYYDNWFSSIPLISALKQQGIHSTCTIRNNRLKGADKLLKKEKDLCKTGRGSMDYLTEADTNICVVRWLDSAPVQLASSYLGSSFGPPVNRFSVKDRAIVSVSCPTIVHEYNKHMGGVDLLDMYLSLYRIRLRSKKNYHYIFYYLLQVSVINSWLLYRRYCRLPNRQQLSLLDFTMDVSESLMRAGKINQQPQNPSKRGRPSRLSQESSSEPQAKKIKRPCPNNSIRFDSIGHLPRFTSSQQKCAYCRELGEKPGYTYIECSKCAVSLCMVKDRNCFTNFHIH